MIQSVNVFEVFFIPILQILFFWAVSFLGITFFIERNKDCDVASEVLSNFLYIYAVINILLTIILVSINDFRLVLFSSLVMCICYYLLINKMQKNAWRRERRKQYRRQVLSYEMAKKKYF